MNTLTTEIYNYQQLPFSGLVEKAIALSATEFDAYIDTLLRIRLKRKVNSVFESESNLLQKINNAVPKTLLKEHDKLAKKMRASTISETEYNQLLEITQTIEMKSVERLKLIADLAALKNLNIDEVIKQYDLMQK